MSAQQGHDFRGYYLHEDNGFLGTPTDTDYKPFGANASFDTAEGTNNAVQVFQPGSRIPIEVVEQVFSGSWGVSFVYTNPYWMNGVLGEPITSSNGDGTYTHVWEGEDVQSLQIHIGREGDSSSRVLSGCVITQVSVTPQLGGMVQVSISGAYADEEIIEDIETQPSIQYQPMTFADASLSIGGVTQGYIQSGSVGIQNNVGLINEWGTRTAIDFAPHSLLPSVNWGKVNVDGGTTELEKLYGSQGSSTVQSDIDVSEAVTIGLDNGAGVGEQTNIIDFNLTECVPNSYNESGLGDPEADVIEEINRMVTGMTVEVTNEDSSAR